MQAESQQTQPLTPLVDLNSDQMLQAFIAWEGSLFDLADQCGLTILQLLDWWQSEPTQAKVKALETLAEARTRLTARLHAPAAISTAARVAEDATVKPPERRRASALVLRHAASRPARRSRQSEPPTPDSPPDSVSPTADSNPDPELIGDPPSQWQAAPTPSLAAHAP